MFLGFFPFRPGYSIVGIKLPIASRERERERETDFTAVRLVAISLFSLRIFVFESSFFYFFVVVDIIKK